MSLTDGISLFAPSAKSNTRIRDANADLENRVRERTRDLSLARDRAESADRLKSTFLATMSHELRTPLNTILGFTGIVLEGMSGPLTAEQSKQLAMVQGSARHLLALINDILDISKIEAGQIEIHPAPFDIGASLEKIVATVTPAAENKSLRISVVAPPRWEVLVSDQRRVEQVLLNLLNNAIKFTDHGEIEVSVEFLRARNSAIPQAPRASVRFRISDTGIGIKQSELGTLFEPFHQIDSATARPLEGSGLGLAICRGLVHMLGGEIRAESRPGAGSTFIVTIPQARRRIKHHHANHRLG